MNFQSLSKNIKVKNVGTAAINNIPTRNILICKMGNDKYLQAEFDELYHLIHNL